MTKEELALFDTFSDGLNIHASPMGVTLQFTRTIIPSPGVPPVEETEKVANIRMSAEQWKFIIYKMQGQEKQMEENNGVRIMLGKGAQEGGGIDAADWNRFWGHDSGTPTNAPTPAVEQKQPEPAAV